MYWIFTEIRFQAYHQLTFSNGSKEVLHAHPWKVVAGVCADKLNSEGLVMDFLELGKVLEVAIEPLRGKQLETLACFSGRNASAEAVARYVFDAAAPRIAPPARLDSVEVTEAEGCRARYQPGA
jgi:6-pyruvoyltetrahydropterin/6-carboxytetrahydropterin synthase